MDTHFNQLVVELYQGIRGVSFNSFQQWAFDRLQSLIPCASGLWGSGTETPRRPHDVFLYHQPRAMFDDGIERAQALDFIWPVMRKNPGVTINSADVMSRRAFVHSDLYRTFARRYGIECVLGTASIDPVSSLYSVISFWRSDPQQPFTESERRMKELLTPHLIEAYKMNRLYHMESLAQPGPHATWATAICDAQGVLYLTDRRFAAVLRTEWADWNSCRLPRKLDTYLQCQPPEPFIGRAVVIQAYEVGGLMLLKARRKAAVDRLGKKERQTALYLAEGRTYQEVATLRHASPATIRNQAHRIYRKLNIMNKAQLAHALVRFTEYR